MKDITVYQQPRHNNNFDLMRLIGAFDVLFAHANGLLWDYSKEMPHNWINDNLKTGYFGLAIFFTISGYLVTQSLLASPSVKRYLIKRFLRIYPAYIVASLILVMILGPLLTNLNLHDYFLHPLTRKFFLENIFILDSQRILPAVLNEKDVNPSAWTISFELKLYWLLLFLFILKKNWFKQTIALVFIVAVLIRLSIPLALLQERIYHDLRSWYNLGFYFLTGSFLFMWRKVFVLHYIGIIVLALCWWITYKLALPGNIAQNLFLAYTILWLCLKTKVLFTIKWDISYGVYIYASPVQLTGFFLIGPNIPLWQFNLLTVPVIIFLAILSWQLIEKKALSLKYSGNRNRPRVLNKGAKEFI